MNPIRKEFQFGAYPVILETGEIARQADGAVMVNMGDTVVLVTVVADKNATAERDFFPLTVDYQEKTYAAGRIPGGFFRREGRPSEKEILTSRLIDRPLRPLFPKDFTNEVQVIATVKSLNPAVDPEIPSFWAPRRPWPFPACPSRVPEERPGSVTRMGNTSLIPPPPD